MATEINIGVLRNIAPSKIRANPENPRLIFRQEEMESLLTSIDKHGIQVPLSVYQDQDGLFVLIDGERRWRCATKLALKSVPALIQPKPSELDNLLLMYNIHALREQWDYFTIASKLQRVISLIEESGAQSPNEIELSIATGLSRGQVRRCRLLLDLPEKYKGILFKELQLPKSRQRVTEDFFIELERSLKTVVRRFPEFNDRLDEIRDVIIKKFRRGDIGAVTDFRQLAKIATGVDKLNVDRASASSEMEKLFALDNSYGIKDAYNASVGFEYEELDAVRQVHRLGGFIKELLSAEEFELDTEFVDSLRQLRDDVDQLLQQVS